jgi:hypothetical protein
LAAGVDPASIATNTQSSASKRTHITPFLPTRIPHTQERKTGA